MSFFAFPNLKLAAVTTVNVPDYPQFPGALFTESYETGEGWGQLADPNAYPTFGVAALTESYETTEGWGQLADPNAYPTFGAAALTESYETTEGWT